MTTITDKTIQSAIYSAWDSKAAESNMERWLSLGEQQDWADSPDNRTLLTQLVFYPFCFLPGQGNSGLLRPGVTARILHAGYPGKTA